MYIIRFLIKSSNKTIHQPGTEGLAAKSEFGHKGINNGKDNLL
jgi:hypothetical protein